MGSYLGKIERQCLMTLLCYVKHMHRLIKVTSTYNANITIILCYIPKYKNLCQSFGKTTS